MGVENTERMLKNVSLRENPAKMLKDQNGDYTFVITDTVPTTGDAGYSRGCICIHTAATNGSGFLVNDGDATGGTFVIREA